MILNILNNLFKNSVKYKHQESKWEVESNILISETKLILKCGFETIWKARDRT